MFGRSSAGPTWPGSPSTASPRSITDPAIRSSPTRPASSSNAPSSTSVDACSRASSVPGEPPRMSTDRSPFRVVQWTTGNVGRRSVLAVLANPGLELVGCYAWSPDKIGRDVGELCGTTAAGVVATNDVDALLALRPDCVVYNPKWPNISDLVQILESGVNVVTTAAFITGDALLPDDRTQLASACDRGHSPLFGPGTSPWLAILLGTD